ncbi:MAG TPA: HAMP domain-containing sensor histidine kinase [Nitrospiraceae bacterium]|nr:HAMP domain-containing sensor histidine kinase [Nitrospiraceae bacterium]
MRKHHFRVKQFVQRSIFIKLFLIYAATMLALACAVSGYNRFVFHNEMMVKQTKSKMMAHHLASIVEEIGHPPDRGRALRLARELGLQIRLEGAEGTWATETDLPATSALNAHPAHAAPDMQTGKYRGRRFVIMARGETRYLFFFPEPPGLDLESVALLIGVIALILIGNYLLVRRLFRPLGWLTRGVAEIAKGNLDHHVPNRSADELGQLTLALNDMVRRIQQMLHARDRLLLDVSHELRSPLTRIKVALEFVPDEIMKNRIQQEVREVEAMVAELLESERLDSLYGGITLADTDLVPLVRDLVEMCGGQKPGVKLVAAPASVTVKLDSQRVRMAVRNILDNAFKHTAPEAGPIEVRIDVQTVMVHVSIRDYGPGIPLNEQAKIFEPFYRVDKSRTRTTGGYGLGLSLAKKIMLAHGGDIVLSSEVGHGSTFILRFLLPQQRGAPLFTHPTT